MARNRADAFLKTIQVSSTDPRAIVEALRIFGYVNEMQYSELNTELTILSTEMIRSDGAETIELVRKPIDMRPIVVLDPEDILPGEY